MKKLFFITSNKGKFAEVKEQLKPNAITVIQRNLGYPEVQADSLEEVTRFGVEYLIAHKVSEPFIIEDAGLFIDALKGFPGVYSKYVYYTIGLPGVLRLLDKVEDQKRTAVFRSVYAFCEFHNQPLFFQGECHGKITKAAVGDSGFGFDPIFIPDGETRTFAQMSIEEKNRFSHRGKAVEKLLRFLKNKKEKRKITYSFSNRED